MNLLGCIGLLFIMACVACFFLVSGVMLVLGTIAFLIKLMVWMAYVGGFVVLLAIVGLILAKLAAMLRK